ncbi:hypothetical protein CB1_000548013 [Camelus ferus]|nr:hypothetical protein CB1_000548013 [Camelus ferus]
MLQRKWRNLKYAKELTCCGEEQNRETEASGALQAEPAGFTAGGAAGASARAAGGQRNDVDRFVAEKSGFSSTANPQIRGLFSSKEKEVKAEKGRSKQRRPLRLGIRASECTSAEQDGEDEVTSVLHFPVPGIGRERPRRNGCSEFKVVNQVLEASDILITHRCAVCISIMRVAGSLRLPRSRVRCRVLRVQAEDARRGVSGGLPDGPPALCIRLRQLTGCRFPGGVFPRPLHALCPDVTAELGRTDAGDAARHLLPRTGAVVCSKKLLLPVRFRDRAVSKRNIFRA